MPCAQSLVNIVLPISALSHELILENVARFIQLKPEEIGYFISILKKKKLRKRTFFLEAGEVCTETAFVISGCLRSYSVDGEGAEHTLIFAPPGWWAADLYSLISGQPAILNIEALEDSELLILTAAAQEELLIKVPAFERFFRILTGNALVAHQQRILDDHSLGAKERYLRFCKRYPTLMNKLPAKLIASYIGVTPEFLSKLKADLSRS
jgi:CRP-like cAMP-binding protein